VDDFDRQLLPGLLYLAAVLFFGLAARFCSIG